METLPFLSLFVILPSFAEVQRQIICWWPQTENSGLWHNSLHHTACQSTSVSELPRDTGVWEHYLVLSPLTHQKASGSWAKAMKHISPRCFHSCMLTSLLAQPVISTQTVLYNLTTKLHTKNVIWLTLLKCNTFFWPKYKSVSSLKFILTFYPIDKAIFSSKFHLARPRLSYLRNQFQIHACWKPFCQLFQVYIPMLLSSLEVSNFIWLQKLFLPFLHFSITLLLDLEVFLCIFFKFTWHCLVLLKHHEQSHTSIVCI